MDDQNRSKISQTESFEFGRFRLDPLSRELTFGDQPVPLTPRALDTVLVLVQHAGRIVDKQTLLERVWGGTFVADGTLTQNVYTVRKALERHDADTEYIETVPRSGYRFRAPVQRTAVEASAADPSVGIRSLAVLPFVSLSEDEQDPFVGLGMADALITALSGLEPVTVRPTSAVMKLAGATYDPIDEGRRLGVDAVLEGRLQLAGEKLRATVQLVRVRDAVSLWAESFDLVFTDFLSVQDDIASRVSRTLRLKLRSRESAIRPSTRSSSAHQAYVKGRYFWNQRSARSLERAIAEFQTALHHDPNYALAHAGIADCWSLLPLYGSEIPKDVFPKAKAAANRAIECDDGSPEAYASFAYVQMFWDWDHEGAENSFRRALELNPGYSTAHHWYAFLQSTRGDHDDAVASGMLALELEPTSLVINTDLGLLLYFARRYDDAAAQFRVALEMHPDFAYARFGLAMTLAQSGRADEAVEQSRRAADLSGNGITMLAALGHALALAGRPDEARDVARQIATSHADPRRHADRLALIWSALADLPRAIQNLEWACADRSRFVVFLDVFPAFDPLRTDPGFLKLVARVRR